MNHRILLAKSIILLFKEHCLTNKSENSADLVRTVVEKIKTNEPNVGVSPELDTIRMLRNIVLEMVSNPLTHEYDPVMLLKEVAVACGDDDKLKDMLEAGFEEASGEGYLKRSIVNLRKSIYDFFKEQNIIEIVNKVAFDFKFRRETIKDVGNYVQEMIEKLDPLTVTTVTKDPAVMSDIDMSDDETINSVLSQTDVNGSSKGILKTGWKGLNTMIQGGIRKGETVIINALQHKYKTGFSLSLFKQLVTNNTPELQDPAKKPLMVRISFEDNLDANMIFLYKVFKYEETKTFVNMDGVTKEDIRDYVKLKMSSTGYYVKMRRVDPTQWSYKQICNYIMELEAEGYEIHALMLDYLAMIPRTGCTNTGVTGSDLRDLFRRIRNFCSSRGIACITPHQLNPEAKRLLRSGIPEVNFVKEVAEKGMTDSCSTLDQEVDLELFIHLFKHNKDTYFSIQRGKHRLPSIVDDDDKFIMYKFPKGMPIPEDINDETPAHIKKLPSANAAESDSSYSFSNSFF